MKKQDLLEEFQEKLKDSKDNKNFKDVLAEYQKKQLEVDSELKKQRDKEDDQLDKKLKERRAKIKASKQVKKAEEFKIVQDAAAER